MDPKDSTNIMLFEEWDNAEYYTGAHMQTEHLQKYILDSRSFLQDHLKLAFGIQPQNLNE
ncbi:MAG: hypothetical protein IPI50_12615 [Saprospiraceae bacterium]|nr:hypothetical protein [Saprospiraceae bacterium]